MSRLGRIRHTQAVAVVGPAGIEGPNLDAGVSYLLDIRWGLLDLPCIDEFLAHGDVVLLSIDLDVPPPARLRMSAPLPKESRWKS
ncbi:hypothetical protein ACF08M_41380 [Streptomyces sp. NPDC015032]|uniref:hypothetical protein n=1 Tax=Streptomyces sp. NPDC015032 TaxID=3364937 RepID=UPI0036F5EAC5